LATYIDDGRDGKKYAFTKEDVDELASSFDTTVTHSECPHKIEGGGWRFGDKRLCKGCWFREKHSGKGHQVYEDETGTVRCQCTIPKIEET
jgi:hypothetical protein